MPRIVNRYAGSCRRCGQNVPAHEGVAVKDAADAAWEVEHAGDCPPNPHNPDDAPTWEIGGGEGYGQEPFVPGTAQREQWWTSEQAPGPDGVPGGVLLSESGGRSQVSGVVTVVTARQRYFADEGMSFGVGDEQGHYYSALVRAATDAEAAPVLAAETRLAVRKELRARCTRLLAWRFGQLDDAQRPPSGTPELDAVRSLPQVPLRQQDDRPLYADELYLDEPGGWVWTVAHNGADGDDFSVNNVPGHIANRHPLTEERRRLVADLRAEYGSLEEWTRAGIPREAAQILVRAGAELHDVNGHRTAVSITNAEDARAYLARTPQQWAEARWEWPTGRRWPAAEAARLADAGISHDHAERLREAGFDTVEQALAAVPPQLPDTSGRFVLRRCRVGPRVQVTDDPDEARRHIARDPQTWEHWEHTPDVTVVHAATAMAMDGGRGWQVWSDGALSIGYWCEPRGRVRDRPTSLPAAAEEVIGLVVVAGNPEIRDQASWQPLLTATAHLSSTVEEAEEGGFSSGETAALVRHDITLADGTTRVLWDVVIGWWYHGEDADVGERHWVSPDETAARRYYRENLPKRR
ncbi:hypothetical protein GCM10027258_80070 [Amycolatopsis stemonae]